jgi:anti-anti-sigma factor
VSNDFEQHQLDGAAGWLPASSRPSPPDIPPATVTPLPAEIDIANAGQVRADLMAVIDQGYPVVIADMSRTSFCDCAGVAALAAAGGYAARRGVQLRIVARARAVLRIFELSGLLLATPVYPTGAAAMSGPGTGPPWPPGAATPGSLSCRRRTDGAEFAPPPGQRRCP